jgi:hypothetical protein
VANTTYPGGIILNEFLANPKTRYDDEWVELYNGGASADLAGWKLDDGEGGGSPYTLPHGATIAPGGYLVIDLSVALLNNDGDTLRLIRPDGVVVDSTSFTDSAPDASRSRSSDGAWYDGGEPTPGQANLPPSGQDTPSDRSSTSNSSASGSTTMPASGAEQVSLNEVLPAPKDVFDAEWIEIANDGDMPADLAGWQIDDAADGGAPLALPPGSVVAPHGLLVVTVSRPLFNNAGDSVRLLRPDGTTADEFSYDGSEPDLSMCRLDSSWATGCEPTPGGPNQGATVASTSVAGDLTAPAAGAPVDSPITTEESGSYAERGLSTMAAPRQPIQLRDANAGAPVYALAMPGSIYAGIWSGAATLSPSPTAAPQRRPALQRTQAASPAQAKAPFVPFAGGVAIVVGAGIVGYERLRLRNAAHSEASERVGADGDPPVEEEIS